jgi:hypothetical protein
MNTSKTEQDQTESELSAALDSVAKAASSLHLSKERICNRLKKKLLNAKPSSLPNKFAGLKRPMFNSLAGP